MVVVKFLTTFLLVSIISPTLKAQELSNYTCLMPCRMSVTNRQSLTEIFTSSVDSYTITTILDGFEGQFKIIVSQDTIEYPVYSTKISVVNWLFESLCRILNEQPKIVTVRDDNTQLKVQFPTFRSFQVRVETGENFLNSRLFEKVGNMQRELSMIKGELQRIQMLSKLKYAISNALITANDLKCKHPNPFVFPTGDRHCTVPTGDWIRIDLREILTVNFILFRLWDQDSREFTYNLSVSEDNVTWVTLAENRTGKSVQKFNLELPMEFRYIKMEGSSTRSRKLHLVSMAIDWI